ncbi:MAG: phasin family protein [Rhodospirillales bacterium]|nr:phasin family protein [Rhodospirillales bacterium]
MTKTAEQFLKPSKIAEELVSQLKALAVKGVDVDAVMASQRKNIEALANASRSTLDGAHAVGKRQAEILQETMTQTAHSLETLAKSASPVDLATKQVELMKEGFGTALGHMRELAEMVSKAQQEAVEAISNGVTQSLKDLQHAAVLPDGAPATKPQPTAAPASH